MLSFTGPRVTLLGSQYIVDASLEMNNVRVTLASTNFEEMKVYCRLSVVSMLTRSELSIQDDVRIKLDTIEVRTSFKWKGGLT